MADREHAQRLLAGGTGKGYRLNATYDQLLMNKTLTGGLILICLGILFLVLGNVEFKTQEEVFHLGNLSATATTAKTVPAFRYAGVAVLAAGFVLLVIGFRHRRKG